MAQRDAYFNPDSVGGDGSTPALTGANAAYSSLASCELNEQDDFVSANDNAYWHGAGVTPDIYQITIDGSITSLTNDIMIEADNPIGQLSTNHYRSAYEIPGSFQSQITIGDDNVTFKNIQVHHINVGKIQLNAIRIDGNNCVVDGCTIAGDDISGISKAIIQSGPYVGTVIKNNLIYNFVSGTFPCVGLYVNAGNAGGVLVYNNTVINTRTAYQSFDNVIMAVNNIDQGCYENYNGDFYIASDYNLSDFTGTMPGGNSTIATLTFIDAANDDYRLSSADGAAIGAGIGPDSDSNVPGLDLSGDIRLGTSTDVGFDAYLSKLSSNQIELGDNQSALIQNVVSMIINQTDLGDTQRVNIFAYEKTIDIQLAIIDTSIVLAIIDTSIALNYNVDDDIILTRVN